MTAVCRTAWAWTSTCTVGRASIWNGRVWRAATTSATTTTSIRPRSEWRGGSRTCFRALQQIAQPVPQHREHQGRAAQQRAARKIAVRDAREQIEEPGAAGDRFGGQHAGDARERDAVPAESLQVPDMGGQAPEVGRAVQGDVDVSAPVIVHARPGELRENAQHPRPRGRRDLKTLDPGITYAAAEQQPVIGGSAEIIEHPVP